MICGFDFGTSHCAMGTIENNKLKLLPLQQQQTFMPSTLYAYDRGLIADYIAKSLTKHQASEQALQYQHDRQQTLLRASGLRREHDLTPNEPVVWVGTKAIEEYQAFPEEGYFVKSPKSFLGASGLQVNQLDFFEDLVLALMLTCKNVAENHLQQSLTKVVIGRPVNFQGTDGEKSNEQALNILTKAAKRCGYQQVEFLYEPLAAGIDFETSLDTDKIVLVVDVGGGTTDCSIVKMGPNRQNVEDRQADFLAHTGKRVGGNDLDIYFAYKQLMPLFGLDSQSKAGLVLANNFFWNAVSINSVVDQTDFYSKTNSQALQQLKRDAVNGNMIQRLIALQANRQNHQLVRSAELAKIALSEEQQYKVDLSFIESHLFKQVNADLYETSVQYPIENMNKLVKDALMQAGVKPDIVYFTGGSAKSSVLRMSVLAELKTHFTDISDIEVCDGDYFGSVTAGLTKWAERIFS
jgi:hypothetical chaperone protein